MKSKIILAALTLCCLLCFGACAQKEGIVGSWETKAASLGSSENQPADNRVIFRFEADLTGKETQIVNGTSHERDFTYTLSDGILRISFDGDPVWEFPCVLEGSRLVLTQNHQDVIYERTS